MEKDNAVASKNVDQPDFNTLFVKMLEDKKQENIKDAKEVRIKNINRYLKSTQNYRTLGLISLSEFLELHSVISTAFTTEKECQELEWLEIVLRMINQKTEEPEKCFPILSKLIIVTAQHPDMHKIVQGKYLGKIIESILANKISITTLQCLAICLKEYSGPSGIFKNKIYDYCIASIDIIDSSLNSLSAKCLHLLQQTRGGSVGGSAHKKNWAEYHEKLLNTLHESFINLLQTGESVTTGKSERLKLPEQAESKKNMPLMYSHQERFIRFQNICIFLNTSLVQPFPAPKSILLDWIFSFLDKSILINQGQINKKDGDRILPYIINIEVQKCLLNILQFVIKAVGRNILIYSKDICDIFWRSLKSTNVPYDEFKISELSLLRCTIYDVIVEFMRIAPNNHFVHKNMENFMKEAFLDITPIQNEILLTLPSSDKKKKKKDPEIKKTLSGKTFDNCWKLHQQLCAKALNFLNNLLTFNGAAMKPVLFKILTDKILIVSYKFLSCDLTQYELYHSTECRLLILELIYNILIHPAIRNATPTSFMVELLKKFKDNDKNDKLRQKASEMIRTVEVVIHNRKDPIHFPSDLKDFRDSWLFNEKIVKAFAEINYVRKVEVEAVNNGNESVDITFSNNGIIQIDDDDSVEEVPLNGKDKSPEKEILVAEKLDDEIMEVETIQKPTNNVKRPSTSIDTEEVPAKIIKESVKETNVTEKKAEIANNDEELLNTYLADFCDE